MPSGSCIQSAIEELGAISFSDIWAENALLLDRPISSTWMANYITDAKYKDILGL